MTLLLNLYPTHMILLSIFIYIMSGLFFTTIFHFRANKIMFSFIPYCLVFLFLPTSYIFYSSALTLAHVKGNLNIEWVLCSSTILKLHPNTVICYYFAAAPRTNMVPSVPLISPPATSIVDAITSSVGHVV